MVKSTPVATVMPSSGMTRPARYRKGPTPGSGPSLGGRWETRRLSETAEGLKNLKAAAGRIREVRIRVSILFVISIVRVSSTQIESSIGGRR